MGSGCSVKGSTVSVRPSFPRGVWERWGGMVEGDLLALTTERKGGREPLML